MTPTIRDAYKLFHAGSAALARVEEAGIRIDVPYLKKAIDRVGKRVDNLTERMKADKCWTKWQRMQHRKGKKPNMSSRPQLGQLLEDLGHKLPRTDKGRIKTDDVALAAIDLPFVQRFRRVERLKKANSTYLNNMLQEVVDGFLHCFFNLHTVSTYRSSASQINVQNIPVRNPMVQEIIRRSIIPRKGCCLLEVDYGALEFAVAACFWRDKNMIRYASDPNKDVHRDMAMNVFLLSQKEWNKNSRYVAKNQFVFPTLYGSYYINECVKIWDAMQKLELFAGKEPPGVPMLKHLAKKGITERGACDFRQSPAAGTFEKHMQKVEQDFNAMFPTFQEQKVIRWEKYQQRGWFKMMTGFICRGHFSRNDLMNYGVQGPAFHLLLWSLIEIQKELRRRKMKSLIIAEIHDSMLFDARLDEVDELIELVCEVMTERVRKHWDWVVVPLKIEIERADNNWFEKRRVA